MKPLAESGDVAAEVCRLIGAAPCDGRSALHNAAYKGHTECIPFLIELGASVSDICRIISLDITKRVLFPSKSLVYKG